MLQVKIFNKNLILKEFFTVVLYMVNWSILGAVDTAMISWTNEYSLAALGISHFLLSLFLIPIMPVMETATALIVDYVKDQKENKLMSCILFYSFLISILILIAFRFFINDLISFANDDPKLNELVFEYLNIRSYELLFVSIILIIEGYFIAIKKTTKLIHTFVIVQVMNIVLNYILIFNLLNLPISGVEGAALGSIISTIGWCTFIILKYLKENKKILFYFLDKEIFYSFFDILVPLIFASCTGCFVELIFIKLIGNIGVEALSMFTLICALDEIIANVGLAYGQVLGVQIGYSIKDNDKILNKQLYYTGLKWIKVFFSIITLLLLLVVFMFKLKYDHVTMIIFVMCIVPIGLTQVQLGILVILQQTRYLFISHTLKDFAELALVYIFLVYFNYQDIMYVSIILIVLEFLLYLSNKIKLKNHGFLNSITTS